MRVQSRNLLPRENLITAFSHLAASTIKRGLSGVISPASSGIVLQLMRGAEVQRGSSFRGLFPTAFSWQCYSQGTFMQMHKILGLVGFFSPFT